MTGESEPEVDLRDCPRCGFGVRPADRFCSNCGLRLPGAEAPAGRSTRSPIEVVFWLGPIVGGLLGFMLGEAIVNQLAFEPAVVIPVAGFVIGIFLGMPVLARLVDRF